MTEDPGGRPVHRLHGRVEQRTVGGGSKSERDALVLDTGDEVLVLRRRHGPSFGPTGLESYVGQHVWCSGTIVGHVLLVDAIGI